MGSISVQSLFPHCPFLRRVTRRWSPPWSERLSRATFARASPRTRTKTWRSHWGGSPP